MQPWADAGRVIVGRYRLEAPVGRGSMGVVWRARDLLLDRDVAVKEVHIAETLTDEERANAYQRTLREAKTAARLNHPGLVTVYDVAEDAGRPWIVMQLVQSQSLDQVLATSGPISPHRAAEMGRQLLSALNVAHAAGVMHRDVKPSNVLLGRDDRAVLTDFGIATVTGDPRLTQTGMVMGSPGFTAPERIRGEDASAASDLWSLGATLFAAVEGHGPFEKRGSAITTMSAIINEDAPPAPAAGPLGPVIAALLQREPADRPDASAASRMITEALPQLPAPASAAIPGYEPTALAAPARPASTPPWAPGPGGAARDFGPADADPVGSMAAAGTQDGEPSAASNARTASQPVSGDEARYGQAVTAYGSPGAWSQAAGAGTAAAQPPDFSSWYDPSPRSGSMPSAQPGPDPGWQAGSGYPREGSPAGPGPAPWTGSAPPAGIRPAPRRRRHTGLWIVLVLLAVLGAGAAAILALRHNTSGTASGPGSTGTTGTSSGSAGGLPARSLQIVDAINRHPGSLPAGWATVTHQAGTGEAAGFSIAAPATWTQSTTGHQTYLRDPSANVNILVDLTPHTFPGGMVEEAEYIRAESLAQDRFPGYRQVGLGAATIRGTRGSAWKFTWRDDGVSQEAIDMLMVLQTPAGAQSYALYMTAPASMWPQLRQTFDEAAETFATRT
jgi:hypothetical protein